MPQRYNGGIDLTWPKTGERGWDSTVFRQFVIKIADHDHTGGGRGRQLSGAALGTNAFSGTSLRLDNAQWFRGRNVANTADLNLLRANTSNELEFGITAVAETFRTTNLFVNTSAASAVPANFANLSDGAAAAKFLAPVGALGVTFQSNQASGDSISLEYVNNSVPVFYQVVSAAGDMAFYPGGTKKIDIGATGIGPTSDNNYKLGFAGTRFSETHTANLYSPNIIDDTGVDVSIGGATKWQFVADGGFFPALDGVYDIGRDDHRVSSVYANAIRAEGGLGVSVNGTNFVSFDSSGKIVPLFATQDIGSVGSPWEHVYAQEIVGPTVATWVPIFSATGGTITTALVSARKYQYGTAIFFNVSFEATITAGTVTHISFTTPVNVVTGYGGGLWGGTGIDLFSGGWNSNSDTTIISRLIDPGTGEALLMTSGIYSFHISGMVEAA